MCFGETIATGDQEHAVPMVEMQMSMEERDNCGEILNLAFEIDSPEGLRFR
jgi:hypothetical protein